VKFAAQLRLYLYRDLMEELQEDYVPTLNKILRDYGDPDNITILLNFEPFFPIQYEVAS